MRLPLPWTMSACAAWSCVSKLLGLLIEQLGVRKVMTSEARVAIHPRITKVGSAYRREVNSGTCELCFVEWAATIHDVSFGLDAADDDSATGRSRRVPNCCRLPSSTFARDGRHASGSPSLCARLSARDRGEPRSHRHYTRSVCMTPLLIGCNVPQRVQRPIIRNDCDGADVDEEW